MGLKSPNTKVSDMNNNKTELQVRQDLLLRQLWKQQTNNDITENERQLKWHPLYGFNGFKVIAILSIILLYTPLGMLKVPRHPNIPLIISFHVGIWILCVDAVLITFCIFWQYWATKKVTTLKAIIEPFTDAATRFACLLAFLNVERDEEDMLRMTVHSILVLCARELLREESKQDPIVDQEEKRRKIENCRRDFDELFNAAKPFGLTEKKWNPYFDEAQRQLDLAKIS
jgi:hypothetical protein